VYVLSLAGSMTGGTDFRLRTCSRSRFPNEIVHRFNLEDLKGISGPSGPWYGNVRRRLRGDGLGISGGGVRSLWCAVASNNEIISALCS
jgi:hypothetical protein